MKNPFDIINDKVKAEVKRAYEAGDRAGWDRGLQKGMELGRALEAMERGEKGIVCSPGLSRKLNIPRYSVN